ncbi:SDR family NAD(P)-dependent oxidoreductase [Streptomyces sp. NPDC091281]|uniref:SDR family NAD(P)-dependent oxidoreductase n=1 Tax=Streptomyces sp. NPDC091281 TaxID=3365985 RepID=UPI0037FC5FE8
MSRIFITGSTDGLGLAAAKLLVSQGHTVVGHARNESRARGARSAAPDFEDVLIGDLESMGSVRALAESANASGRFDAVIHNAGIGFREPRKRTTVDRHAHVLAINVLAPYVLTSLMTRPDRLVYLSSVMHRSGDDSLADPDWNSRRWDGSQAYADTKLFDAVLAFAVARRWPDVLSNAVEPGWVATKMGGRSASDNLALGHVTQAWLAAGSEPGSHVTGEYFYHQRKLTPDFAVRSTDFQEKLLRTLEELTGVALPE